MSSFQEMPGRFKRFHTEGPARSLVAFALVGFIIFATFQVILPLFADTESMTAKLITKEEAIERAQQVFSNEVFASSSRTNAQTRVQMDAEVIYHTNDMFSGYINKENLTKSYKPWEALAPYDVYRVLIRQGQGKALSMEYATIDIHMNTGKLAGYQIRSSLIPTSSSTISEEERITRTKAAILELGYKDSQLQFMPVATSNQDTLTYAVPAAKLGEADLEIKATWQGDRLISLNPIWHLPESYAKLMHDQKQSADHIQTYAYTWASFLMGLAAVICAIVYRKHIQFRSRTVMIVAALSCLISIMHAWNMLPSFFMHEQQLPISALDLKFPLLLQSGITFIQGGITLYLAMVVGRALWLRSKHARAQLSLVSSWKQDHFGQHIVDAFWCGLCWTGILLGLQTIIFTLLEYGVQSWTSSDSLTSPLNLSYMYLYPLLAYVAAISEEGFYRLFGVGLFRRFIPNVWIAALIPTFIWAAGHVTYPIYPFYSRPIELMIIGLLFVWIMIRHGFWTAVIAHLMLDTILMVLSLFLEQTLAGTLIGSVYLLLPVALVYGLRSLHNRRSITSNWTAS